MTTDLKIDLTDDISITKGLVDTITTDGDTKGQRIRERLLTVRGEWFLDTEFGLDYRGVVYNKRTPRPVLAAHVQREILAEADEGDKITVFDLTFDGATRALTIEATLESVDGTTTNVSV